MNAEILNELINRYEENLDMLYDKPQNEIFKWKAMKCWRDEWSKPGGTFASFAERFTAATKEFSVLIDNTRMHPSTGVLKLCEKAEDNVKRLFCDVLFADANGDVSAVQDNMDRFLDGYEALRRQYFPQIWSFKQDRHSASVFIAMNDPENNFVFKASEAREMARYTEFGFDIGSGESFSLPNYYRLCETVVAALKEHGSLLEKHFDRLTPEHCDDRSLHLLAFDVMYCCRAYNLYAGLEPPRPQMPARRKAAKPELTPEQIELLEKERLARIDELEKQIAELEIDCDEYSEISLIGVQVTAEPYGDGIVTEQDANRIKVKFAEIEKSYILDGKYIARPHFENDDVIVEAFTEYGRKKEQAERFRRELAKMQN